MRPHRPKSHPPSTKVILSDRLTKLESTAVHKVYGEVIPLQLVSTSAGRPALRVRCPDGQERVILLLETFWVTPIAELLSVSTEPPKRGKAKSGAAGNVQTLADGRTGLSSEADELRDLDERLDSIDEADRDTLADEQGDEFQETVYV